MVSRKASPMLEGLVTGLTEQIKFLVFTYKGVILTNNLIGQPSTNLLYYNSSILISIWVTIENVLSFDSSLACEIYVCWQTKLSCPQVIQIFTEA